MNKQFTSILIKVCILVGAFFLGLAIRSHAQTTPPGGNPADTTHPHRFHRPAQGGLARGQEFRGRDFGRGGRGQQMHFTPEQRQQMMAINKEYRQKADDLFKQNDITLKQYKTSLLALQKERKEKTEALLTQQQKDGLAAKRKRMSDNRQVREVAHLERLKLSLNLTDDQVAKLKSGQEDLRNQAKAIHGNDQLLPQEKMQQMRALIAKRNDTFKSVLTPDQYSQFEKMHQRRPGGFDRPGGFGRPGRHYGDPNSPNDPGGPGGPGGRSAAI